MNLYAYEAQLLSIVRDSAKLMSALQAARTLNLPSWCIGAGAVRNLVWSHLHTIPPQSSNDIDLVYFDSSEAPESGPIHLEKISKIAPEFDWDLTNQAYVHTWYEQQFGYSVPPLNSLEQGISTWPEFATCVGVSLDSEENLKVIAPHGLSDLFSLIIRHNPIRASYEEFTNRHTSKRWKEKWPQLQIITAAH